MNFRDDRGTSAYIIAVVIISGLVFPIALRAQSDIPLGSWRTHLSYHSIGIVAESEELIFGAQESGVIIFERQTGTLRTLNKLNGLTGSGITALAYDAIRSQLLIGYDDGNLDIVRNDRVIPFGILKDAPVTGSKKINHVLVHGGNAFLSTPYGVVKFDLQAIEVRETWRDLGASGQQLAVNRAVVLHDSIFLATARGVLGGALSDNLLDFNNWKRFQTGVFSGSIASVSVFENQLFATGARGVYRYEGGTWQKEDFLADDAVTFLQASGTSMLMVSGATLWQLTVAGTLSQVEDPLLPAPSMAVEDTGGSLWVADRASGLVSNTTGAFSSYIPGGPSIADPFRVTAHDNRIWMVAGGFSASGSALGKPGRLDVFENGMWRTTTFPPGDLTDVTAGNGQLFVSSFGGGVLVNGEAGGVLVLDETNSPLQDITGEASNITALLLTAQGLWVANHGGTESLHRYKEDHGWESYAFGFPNALHPVDLVEDRDGTLWMPLRQTSGGGLLAFNPGRNEMVFKTTATGSGALPDASVNCISVDRNGIVWIGTGSGVAYFLSINQDATRPIFENRFLLRDEAVTAIAVDGGNRKWIGTRDGVWLFDATGETLLLRFTAEDSPLLSNNVRDIAIDPETGEVFFATDKGLVSYRGDATTGGAGFQDVLIFPNPVPPAFTGTVGISGLAIDAVVRITDVSGRLIWQTQAYGGTATWNLRDPQGRRAPTGVYLVFASTADGSESIVGKFAVIE